MRPACFSTLGELRSTRMVDTSFPVQRLARPSAEPRTSSSIARLDTLLFVLFVTGMVTLLFRGWQFYTLGVGERVDHEDFRVLGPSSSLGQAYGVAGTCLLLTNLLYLVRRRFARLSVGSLRAWLDVHAFTGLFGGMLVVFHSAFQIRSTISLITIGSLFVVLATGVVGRFLYALAPRPDLRRLHRALERLDQCGPGLGRILNQQVSLVARTSEPAHGSLLSVVLTLPAWRRELAARRAVIEQVILHYRQHVPAEVQRLSEPIALCRRLYAAEVRAEAAGALLRSWRALHRFSALLMVSLVAMHIAVAWYYGFVLAVSG
jgi:dihydropyrimidine dehydrogenase (NAD+) subunit PreT